MSLELDFLVRVLTQALWLGAVLLVLVDLCRRAGGEFLSFSAAVLALGVIGYAFFWLAYANYQAFGVLKIAVLAVILLRFALIVYRRRLRDYRWLAEPLLFTGLFFAVVIALAFANGGLNDPSTVARTRLSEELPLDNAIPLMVAIALKAGHIASPLYGDWLSSDRPPLQAGLYLLLTLQATDLSYQVVASLLQATFLFGAWGLLAAMGISGAPRRLVLLACCLLPIAIVNTLFTWPKMLAAGYLLLVFALLFCQPPRGNVGRGLIGVLSGGLAALAALSHGTSFFPLIGFAVTILVFWAWPPIRTTIFGVTGFLALYLPWALYQRFIDPPGNRLLKWHLAGVTAVDDRGLITALRDAYGALSWQDYAAGKIVNLEVLLGSGFAHLYELGALVFAARFDLVAAIRHADFFNLVPSMHVFSIAALIAIVLLRFMPAEDRRQRDVLLRLLVATIATCGALVVVIFIPGQTINHVGSYATQVMIAIFAISVVALRAPALAIGFVALQAVTVGAVYGVALTYDAIEDITEPAGVACAGMSSTGAAFADLDGDGDLDLIVNSVGNGTRLFSNDGRGRFTAAPTVLNSRKGGMSLALADVDGDGFLDLYVVNYRTSALMDMPNARATFKTVDGKQTVATVNGHPVTEPDLIDRFNIGPRGAIEENGEPDVLYRNVDGTNFVDVPFTGGNFLDEAGRPLAKPPLDWGLAAMFRDINGDGLPDLYVCNDFQTPDRFWINQGGGRFRLLPRLAQRKSSLSSMAVDFADINRDGFDDFLVLDMMSREHSQRMRLLSGRNEPGSAPGQFDDRPQYELNTLFLNRGDLTFAEIAQLSGLEAAEWAWSCIFLDVDLDGWEDLLVVNGMERAARDLDVVAFMKKLRARRNLSDAEIFQARRMFPRLATPNLAFRNRGDLTFEEVGQAWGFDWTGISSAMALADLDNDGDLDVVVNNLNAVAGIFRNDAREPRVAVRLKGQAPNTRGIGAKIKVLGGPVPVQSQEMICGGRYLSCDDTLRVFAAGSLTNDLRIEVMWRNGKRSLVSDVKPNCLYEIDESGARDGGALERQSVERQSVTREALANRSDAPTLQRSNAPTLFADVSALLQHTHHDDLFDDFSRQPLLANKLSQLGPGVAWFDVDGDGREDLIVGSGKGGVIGVYQNRGTNGFERLQEAVFPGPVTRDQTSILGWRSSTNQTFLLAGCANYEDGLANGPAVRQYDFARKVVDDILTTQESSTGPLALADPDGDGTLDLFVGGRVIPGRYPEAASSRICRQNGNRWRVDGETTRILEKVGLVSGAVFSDLDGDGFAELILACEWGPIRIFRNVRGKFVPWDLPVVLPGAASNNEQHLTISQLTGWWNGVTAGDFDGDGRLDLAASNWGRNTKYQSHRTQPLTIYYGDFAGDGTVQLVEAHYEAALQKTVSERQLDDLAKGLPFLNETFSSHRAYSIASVAEVLGDRSNAAKNWQANWLESTVFLNRGDHFEVRVLPVEAQMAPVFGICIGDFDGDGNEDLFLAQNFFATQPETPRYDAGRALWLRGDGRGGFSAVSGQESGVAVYGEGRGCALCDFDGDGRVDLAVAQNSAATKLYRNQTGRVGLRVRLEGPAGNPQGIGAVLRLKWGERFGPAREVHGGSGYWSQDSAVQVMATPAAPTQIWVRWPGGKTMTADIPAGAREINVGFDGQTNLLQ